MRVPGAPFRGYGQPSRFEDSVTRGIIKIYGDLAPGAGVSMTPLQSLNGTITPNGLHFNRSHNGVPDVDPEKHTLLIHGLVERPLKFDMDAMLRYPSVSRIYFIECSGNSFFNSNLFSEPKQMPVGMIHGLVSAAEWTGIPMATLLDEAGIRPEARWVLAEGADSAAMSRSVPIEKCLDDAMIALYQNGERIRPEQGYPMRLLLPGFEGNMSVKWLRRLKLTAKPTHTKDETSKYTDLMPDGKARQFTYPMGVKSVITRPAIGLAMRGPGFYEVSGLAWTGHGRIVKVEISADGGTSWADGALSEPNLPHALVRFRLPWQWDGSPVVLMSRATDEKGNIQPTRAVWSPQYAAGQLYHCNAIQSWSISADGEIKNVYV
jgi:sulfane dehydrogenase subunit SoxC